MFAATMLYLKDADLLRYSMSESMRQWGVDINTSLITQFSLEDAIRRENFHQFTLKSSEIQTIGLFSIALYCTIALVAHLFFGERSIDSPYSQNVVEEVNIRRRIRRKMSSVLSLFNSGLLTIVAFYYWFQKFGTLWDPRTIVEQLNESANSEQTGFWTERDNVGVAMMIWFLCFNVVDRVIGGWLAPEYVNTLSSRSLHLFNVYTMSMGLTGSFFPFGEQLLQSVLRPQLGADNPAVLYMQTLIPQLRTQTCIAPLASALVGEASTFILALGTVFPALSADGIFGLTFLVLRLAYPVVLISAFPDGNSGKYVLCSSFILYALWFASKAWKYSPDLPNQGSVKQKTQ